jgi:hypothetical protein
VNGPNGRSRSGYSRSILKLMAIRLLRLSLDHNGIVTMALLVGLLVNLLVIGVADPSDSSLDGSLPNVASCQGGGGPGCAEQPLIPPPSVGLPRFEAPPPAVFGLLVAIEPRLPAALREAPLRLPERPPLATFTA